MSLAQLRRVPFLSLLRFGVVLILSVGLGAQLWSLHRSGDAIAGSGDEALVASVRLGRELPELARAVDARLRGRADVDREALDARLATLDALQASEAVRSASTLDAALAQARRVLDEVRSALASEPADEVRLAAALPNLQLLSAALDMAALNAMADRSPPELAGAGVSMSWVAWLAPLGIGLLLWRPSRQRGERLQRILHQRLASRDARLQRLRSALARMSLIVQRSPVAVVLTDAEGVIEYVNPAFERSSGYGAESLLGHSNAVLRSTVMPSGVFDDMWRDLQAGHEWQGELCNRRRNGEFYWEQVWIAPLYERGVLGGYVAVKEDITQRKADQSLLWQQAHLDELTGLPNRAQCLQRLDEDLPRALERGLCLGVLLVDVDHFRRINDGFGHAAGDAVLRELAQRLGRIGVSGDSAGRLGADEFLVLATRHDQAALESLAQTLNDAITAPFFVDGKPLHVGCSIGYASAPGDAIGPARLLQCADMALSAVKACGRGVWGCFDAAMAQGLQQHLLIEQRLRDALRLNALSLHYQPVIALEDGRIVGAEALLRWNDAELGEVPPDVFIPVAEDSSLIVTIGEWVLDTACAELAHWRSIDPGSELHMAVNVSVRQFAEPFFAMQVAAVLARHGLPAQALTLEITETLLLDGDARTLAAIEECAALGVRIAVDDFGTGYASLAYLKRIPVHALKIDRSFIADLPGDRGSAALVSAIVAMATALDLEVVAEGIESLAQADFAFARGAHAAQGYFYGRPASALSVRARLSATS